jgi:hypothetical protein
MSFGLNVVFRCDRDTAEHMRDVNHRPAQVNCAPACVMVVDTHKCAAQAAPPEHSRRTLTPAWDLQLPVPPPPATAVHAGSARSVAKDRDAAVGLIAPPLREPARSPLKLVQTVGAGPASTGAQAPRAQSAGRGGRKLSNYPLVSQQCHSAAR